MLPSASRPGVGEGEGAAGGEGERYWPPATPGEQTVFADLHESDLGGRTSEPTRTLTLTRTLNPNPNPNPKPNPNPDPKPHPSPNPNP